jgi:uncharacterized protein
MRLVLDTNVLVSGFLWEGKPRQLLDLGIGKEIVFFTSAPILAELDNVLSRRKFAKRVANSLLSTDQFVESYLRQAVSVHPVPTPRIVSDFDDDVIIGTALAANADLVVTGDKALLSVAEYAGIRIVSAAEALRILSSQ